MLSGDTMFKLFNYLFLVTLRSIVLFFPALWHFVSFGLNFVKKGEIAQSQSKWKHLKRKIQPPHSTPQKEKFILYVHQKPLDVTNHSVAREVVTFFTLPPGEYIVMPQTNVSTFFGKSDINCPEYIIWYDNDVIMKMIMIDQVPNCDGKFLLRILTDEQSNIW